MKPFLLYGTPRSGSTLSAWLLAEYFRQAEGTEFLHEYFNPLSQDVREAGKGIEIRLHIESPRDLRIRSEAIAVSDGVARSRLELLKKYRGRYSLKLLSHQDVGDGLPWLKKSFRWFLVERRDLFQQLLSYAISELTGFWYLQDGIRLPDESLTATDEVLEKFWSIYFSYLLVKKSLKGSAPCLVLEETLGKSPAEILRGLGLDAPFDESRFRPPPIQNRGDKLRLFRNPELIRAWYRASPLQQLSPIGG